MFKLAGAFWLMLGLMASVTVACGTEKAKRGPSSSSENQVPATLVSGMALGEKWQFKNGFASKKDTSNGAAFSFQLLADEYKGDPCYVDDFIYGQTHPTRILEFNTPLAVGEYQCVEVTDCLTSVFMGIDFTIVQPGHTSSYGGNSKVSLTSVEKDLIKGSLSLTADTMDSGTIALAGSFTAKVCSE